MTNLGGVWCCSTVLPSVATAAGNTLEYYEQLAFTHVHHYIDMRIGAPTTSAVLVPIVFEVQRDCAPTVRILLAVTRHDRSSRKLKPRQHRFTQGAWALSRIDAIQHPHTTCTQLLRGQVNGNHATPACKTIMPLQNNRSAQARSQAQQLPSHMHLRQHLRFRQFP